MFVIGQDPTTWKHSTAVQQAIQTPSQGFKLSRQATIGRNSQFRNLTSEDKEQLGGIEYRSLKLLLKIVTGKHLIPLLTTGTTIKTWALFV